VLRLVILAIVTGAIGAANPNRPAPSARLAGRSTVDFDDDMDKEPTMTQTRTLSKTATQVSLTAVIILGLLKLMLVGGLAWSARGKSGLSELILKALLVLYILQSLHKFFDFFYISYEKRIARIRAVYAANGVSVFDTIALIVVVALLALQFAAGVEYLSFTTGLLVGMTLIQLYFHRFNQPLAQNQSPDPPVYPIKLLSYAIQAMPGRPWREMTLMTILLCWALYMLLAKGFALPLPLVSAINK
jgi:hypothetical protein